MNVNEISLHARSKRELNRLLQLNGNVYLPPLEQANHKYIADVLSWKKKVWFQFLIYVVCQEFEFDTNSGSIFKNLRVTNIWAFSKDKINIDEYLPVFKQEDKLPERIWIFNVGKIKFTNLVAVNTLLPEDFKAFVKKQIKQNDLIHIAKNRQEIDVIPEFSKFFKEWETISSKIFILNLIELSGRLSQLPRSGIKRTSDDIEKKNTLQIRLKEQRKKKRKRSKN